MSASFPVFRWTLNVKLSPEEVHPGSRPHFMLKGKRSHIHLIPIGSGPPEEFVGA